MLVLAAATLVVKAPPTQAPTAEATQVDYFLKIEGIEGESQARGHQGEIELLSWSWGETNAGVEHMIAGVGQAGAGQPEFADIAVEAYLSKTSPKIMEAVATGQYIPQVVLTGVRQGETQLEYLKITMTDVFARYYQTGGSQSDILPVDNVSFNYQKIEYEFTPQKADGTAGSPVKAGYDLKKNQKI